MNKLWKGSVKSSWKHCCNMLWFTTVIDISRGGRSDKPTLSPYYTLVTVMPEGAEITKYCVSALGQCSNMWADQCSAVVRED